LRGLFHAGNGREEGWEGKKKEREECRGGKGELVDAQLKQSCQLIKTGPAKNFGGELGSCTHVPSDI